MKVKNISDISKILDNVGIASKSSKRILELDPMLMDDPQVRSLVTAYIGEEKYDKIKDVYKKFMEIYSRPREVNQNGQ